MGVLNEVKAITAQLGWDWLALAKLGKRRIKITRLRSTHTTTSVFKGNCELCHEYYMATTQS